MTWLTWLLLVGYVLLSVALHKIFEKAGEDPKKAFIPIYNFVVVGKIVGRSSWYGWLMLVPVLNIFIFSALMVDLARSFGRNSFWQDFAAVVVAPFYFGWLGRQEEVDYEGPILEKERAYLARLEAAQKTKNKREINKVERSNPNPKNWGREWAESAIFAVFAATFIRLLFIEPYIIPTPSMEGSLMVGDFLFVSKAHYGLRLPETVLQLPLVHNRAPFINAESYLEKPSLPYRRLPMIENLDRYDPVVFNMPAGDSVYIFPDRVYSSADYETGLLAQANPRYAKSIQSGRTPLVTRPRDKKDLYVKRAVGMPGDLLEIRDRELFIDGEKIAHPSTVQFLYVVEFSAPPNTISWGDLGIADGDIASVQGNTYFLYLGEQQKTDLRAADDQVKITPFNYDQEQFMGNRLYPHNAKYYGNWSNDNYGPIKIPAAGETIQLTPENYWIYWRPIKVYEGNDLEVKNGQYYINGQVATEYTFKKDYYWMMGDNRHNSEDSRVWGFVPFDHVVGKPLFIWFSIRENDLSKGIEWKRIFKSASAD